MVYYFIESQKLALETTFHYEVEDEKAMRKEWVAKFWTISCFYVTENGDLFYHYQMPLYYRSKQKAAEQLLKCSKTKNHEYLLVLHTIDHYRFHWLDFYRVSKEDDGSVKFTKLKKKKANLDKDNNAFDENGKIVFKNAEFLK